MIVDEYDDMLSTAELVAHVGKIPYRMDDRNTYKTAVEKVETKWRTWMENRFASDMPESLLDELWDRGVLQNPEWLDSNYSPLFKYTFLVNSYKKNILFAFNAIEMTKNHQYKNVPISVKFDQDVKKFLEETYASNLPVNILDELWDKTFMEARQGGYDDQRMKYISNVNFAFKAIESARGTGYLTAN